MTTLRPRMSVSVWLGLVVASIAASVPGCDEPLSPSTLAKQCGLDVECTAGGFAEGKASISGIASIDAFFGASIDLVAAAKTVNANIRAELDAIAVSVGLEPGASAANIEAAIQARIALATRGGIRVTYESPRCEASAEVVASAAAECDAQVDPGEASFECSGSCEVEAGVAVDCGAQAKLECEFTAPNVECSGMCQGACELAAGATCEGICKGGCEGECSVENADGTCNGVCTGTCTGSCELEAKAECDGTCQGTCEVEGDPSVGCEAGAQARCEAMGDATIECSGSCEGKAEPPQVSAECEASVEAKASVNVECRPPSVSVEWAWSAELEGDAAAQAEFKGWIQGMKLHLAALAAATAKAELLLDGSEALVAAAEGVVLDFAKGFDLRGDAEIRDAIGAGCALQELPIAAEALASTTQALSTSFTAASRVTVALTTE